MADRFVTWISQGVVQDCYIHPCDIVCYRLDYSKGARGYRLETEESLIMLEDRRDFLHPGGFFTFNEQLYECTSVIHSDAWKLTRIDIEEFDARKCSANDYLKKIGTLPEIADIILEYDCLTKRTEFFPKYVTDTFKDTSGLSHEEKQVLVACLVPQQLFAYRQNESVFAGIHYLFNSSPSLVKKLIADRFLVKF